ncbi:hypothetical protein [Actinomadura sp. NTSP31]|uniref:hypothetical protein n=1 Tax=Actinomadura sp. NTSP31 TaxID=1735447 RepID=UPI0035BF2F92
MTCADEIFGKRRAATFGAAEPDSARVKVELASLEQSPAEAFQAEQTVITGFRVVLRAHGIPDAGVSPSRLRPATHYEFDRAHDETLTPIRPAKPQPPTITEPDEITTRIFEERSVRAASSTGKKMRPDLRESSLR